MSDEITDEDWQGLQDHLDYNTRQKHAVNDILSERFRQDEKWGEQNHGDLKWLTVLQEEMGEVARAILEKQPSSEARAEIVQVAAVAVAWLECLERREENE